jgi:hypothetical protein
MRAGLPQTARRRRRRHCPWAGHPLVPACCHARGCARDARNVPGKLRLRWPRVAWCSAEKSRTSSPFSRSSARSTRAHAVCSCCEFYDASLAAVRTCSSRALGRTARFTSPYTFLRSSLLPAPGRPLPPDAAAMDLLGFARTCEDYFVSGSPLAGAALEVLTLQYAAAQGGGAPAPQAAHYPPHALAALASLGMVHAATGALHPAFAAPASPAWARVERVKSCVRRHAHGLMAAAKAAALARALDTGSGGGGSGAAAMPAGSNGPAGERAWATACAGARRNPRAARRQLRALLALAAGGASGAGAGSGAAHAATAAASRGHARPAAIPAGARSLFGALRVLLESQLRASEACGAGGVGAAAPGAPFPPGACPTVAIALDDAVLTEAAAHPHWAAFIPAAVAFLTSALGCEVSAVGSDGALAHAHAWGAGAAGSAASVSATSAVAGSPFGAIAPAADGHEALSVGAASHHHPPQQQQQPQALPREGAPPTALDTCLPLMQSVEELDVTVAAIAAELQARASAAPTGAGCVRQWRLPADASDATCRALLSLLPPPTHTVAPLPLFAATPPPSHEGAGNAGDGEEVRLSVGAAAPVPSGGTPRSAGIPYAPLRPPSPTTARIPSMEVAAPGVVSVLWQGGARTNVAGGLDATGSGEWAGDVEEEGGAAGGRSTSLWRKLCPLEDDSGSGAV